MSEESANMFEELDAEIRTVHETVRCAYLDISYGIGLAGTYTPLLLTCRNELCGPEYDCSFCEGRGCDYRNETADPDIFFDGYSERATEEEDARAESIKRLRHELSR